MARRGNPNWGKGCVNLPYVQDEFSKLVERLGLEPHELENSAKLRAWAEKNRTQRYVPETLLVAWGLELRDEGDCYYS